jgi:tetratricopeptide (TPR) repeat protein
MVSNILNTTKIHQDLEEFILEKTEGVPFFIEEFIRSLKDLKIIEKKDSQYLFAKDFLEMTIPSTIQDVIMARVDALPEGAKEVIQTGSVIEREFSYQLIKGVTGLSEQELLSRLSVLKDSELVFERGIYPDAIYIFKHALTRDVVYDSILTRRKEQLHENIGNAIEEIYKESIDEYYGLLTEHYIYSKNYEKVNDAISYAKKRISCLEKLPVDDDVEKKIISARTVLGLYYTELGLPVEARATIDSIVDLAIKHSYKRRVSQINIIMGFYYVVAEEDIPKAFEYLENALKIGKKLNDLLSLVLANTYLGCCFYYNCEFSKGNYYFEKALEINIEANALWGISALKAWIAHSYIFQGNIDLAHRNSLEALRIADETGDIYSKAHAYTAHGWVNYIKGYFQKAEIHLGKGVDFSERINHLAWAVDARFGLGMTYFEMENHKMSLKQYERALYICQQNSVIPSYANCFIIASALSKVMNSETDVSTPEIIKYYYDSKLKTPKAWMLSLISEILLNIDDQHISETEDWIKRSIETHIKYGMMWHLARDYALYAELFKRKGDLPKAKENLTEAIDIFKECGADGWVKRYEKELASL